MGRYISDLKDKYISNLVIYNQDERAKELSEQDDSEPIYKPLIVHEDEEPIVQEHNTMFHEICLDINGLNAELSTLAYDYYELIEDAQDAIKKIQDSINSTLEAQNDMNMLCSAYSNCNNFVSISKEHITDIDDSLITDNIIHTKELSSVPATLRISNVSGNGYAGNGHVYDNSTSKYLSNTFDTSKVESILNSTNTGQYFEYSRLSSNSNTVVSCSDVNYDSNGAKCSLYLQSDSVFNVIKIDSDQQHLKIVDIFTSLDGASYSTLSDFHNFEFNNDTQKYNTENYIIGSGIFNLPDSKYIKITFESNEYDSKEVLAYQNKTIEGSAVKEKTEIINNTYRYKIKINAIQAFRKTYESSSLILTDDLVGAVKANAINSIALYAAEYCPISKSYNKTIDNYIKYSIIINETEYPIIPINRNSTSDTNKTKIIRIKNDLSNSENAVYLSDDIKSMKIKVVLNCIDKFNSPYISNMKLLVAEDVNV